MMTAPCFICDDLRPEYADMLCADHWLLHSVKALVTCGAWSEFDMDAYGKRPNHAAMMLSHAIADERKRVYDELDTGMGGIGLAREIRRWAEEGAALERSGATYDTSGHESYGDGLWLERGEVARWIRDELVYVMVKRWKGQAA